MAPPGQMTRTKVCQNGCRILLGNGGKVPNIKLDPPGAGLLYVLLLLWINTANCHGLFKTDSVCYSAKWPHT